VATLLEQFTAEINRYFFLREYSFDKNRFKAACRSELELADHVIRLPEALFIFQIKERGKNALSDERSVETWFQQKVIKAGCGQISDSTRFLSQEPEILVRNQRGHCWDLAHAEGPVIPIILYASGATLPTKVEHKRHHVSRRAGFVHVMNVRDYYHLCRTLVLPRELAAYFHFRQDMLLRNPQFARSEAVIAAQFISQSAESPSDLEAKDILQKTNDDNPTLDLTKIIGKLGDKVNYLDGKGADLDYYRLLAELARLGRAEMRGLKGLLKWAQDNAGAEDPPTPMRLITVDGRVGFVVFPVYRGALTRG
jgi:hypothetical protein